MENFLINETPLFLNTETMKWKEFSWMRPRCALCAHKGENTFPNTPQAPKNPHKDAYHVPCVPVKGEIGA